MANVLRDLNSRCHGGTIKGQRRGDELIGQDAEDFPKQNED